VNQAMLPEFLRLANELEFVGLAENKIDDEDLESDTNYNNDKEKNKCLDFQNNSDRKYMNVAPGVDEEMDHLNINPKELLGNIMAALLSTMRLIQMCN